MGPQIRHYRRAKNLKVTELAELLGVHRTVVHRWESGELQPKSDRVPAIAAALDVGAGALFAPVPHESS